MSTDTEEDVWEKKHAEFEGDVECPFDHCEASGSDLWTIDHFIHSHDRVDKRQRFIQFIRTDEYNQWGPDVEYRESKRGPSGFSKRTIDQQVTDAVEAHPVFEVDMYDAYFGSISEAVSQCHQGSHPDYDSRTEYDKRREFIEMKDQMTEGSAHKVYGSNWRDIAWKIYERDEFKCRICGDKPDPSGGLDVHHITPAREFDDQSAMNDPSNLIALCKSCHGQHEGKYTQCNHNEFVRRVRSEQRATSQPTGDSQTVDVLDRIPHLDVNYQVCLLALAVLEKRGDAPARTKQVYSEYKQITDLVGIDQLTQRTVRKKLNDLDTCNLVDVHAQNGDLQGGKYYVAELSPGIESILSGFERVDRFDEIKKNLTKFSQQSTLSQ